MSLPEDDQIPAITEKVHLAKDTSPAAFADTDEMDIIAPAVTRIIAAISVPEYTEEPAPTRKINTAFKATHGREDAAAREYVEPPEDDKDDNPPPTTQESTKSQAQRKLASIATLHRDRDVFPNQSLLREWPELFPSNLSTTATLGSQGLTVVSIHTSSHTNIHEIANILFKEVNHAIITNIAPNLINGDGYFVDIIIDEESADQVNETLASSGCANAIKTGGTNAELSFTHSGINIIGQDIENLHQSLINPAHTNAYLVGGTKNEELEKQQDFLRRRNLRTKAEKPTNHNVRERFLTHIRLEMPIGSELRAIQQTISIIATSKYGCQAIFSNTDIIIFSEAERPTSIGRAVRDEIREYLERVYGKDFTTKIIRGDIGYTTNTQENTTRIGVPKGKQPITIPGNLEGDFVSNLGKVQGIPGVISTDESMIPFTNSSRYFDLGLQLETIEYDGIPTIRIKQEKAPILILERGFVGREDEKEQLQKLMESTVNGAKIIEVKGVAGVGKTELLLQSMPKDTIIIRPGEGKTGIEIEDLSKSILAYINNNEIDGNAKFTEAQAYLKTLSENSYMYTEDEFSASVLCILEVISQHIQKKGTEEFFVIMIDDIDDIKPPSFGAILRLIGEIRGQKGKMEKHKNILIALSRRSDINYSEDMGESIDHIGRHLSLRFISDVLVSNDAKIQIEPLKLGTEKDGTIEYAAWLEEFIVGKVIQKIDNGQHAGKISETRVRSAHLIGNLLAQMAGRKQEDGTIFAVPHYMVQAINELIHHGYLHYDPETNEIYLTNPSEAKNLLPKEPEGIHEIQFGRLVKHEQRTICALAILEGIDNTTVEILKKKLQYMGLLDQLKGAREILEKSETVTIVRQWRTFLKAYLEKNPDIEDDIKVELITAILDAIQINGPEKSTINPIVLFKLVNKYVFDNSGIGIQQIVSQNSLSAATKSIEEYKFHMAVMCAEHFLAQINISEPDKFKAHVIALRASIANNDEEKAAHHRENAKALAQTSDQKQTLAQIALQGAYHQFKHSQIHKGEISLDLYDQRIYELESNTELQTTYQKALLIHHKASALKERLFGKSYDHTKHKDIYGITGEEKPNDDQIYQHAIELAEQAQQMLNQLIQEKNGNLEQREKEIIVANLNLLCVLHLEIVRSWYDHDNPPIIEASENGETKVVENLRKGQAYARQSLKTASKYRVIDPEIMAKGSFYNALSTMYLGQTDGLQSLIRSAMAQIGYAHTSTAESMLAHVSVAALDVCKVKAVIPEDLTSFLLEINYDTNADIYSQDPSNIFGSFNYAEACIFKSLSLEGNAAKKELQKSIVILKETKETFKKSKYFGLFIEMVAHHALAAKRLGEDTFNEFAPHYQEILDKADVIAQTQGQQARNAASGIQPKTQKSQTNAVVYDFVATPKGALMSNLLNQL